MGRIIAASEFLMITQNEECHQFITRALDLRPQGGHNYTLAILIIGLGQLYSSLLVTHKMLPCAELLQRLALWVLLDKHCSSQEV